MKKKLSLLLAFCFGVFLPCALLSSCAKKPSPYSAHSFDYFDTVTTVTGYAEDQEAFDAVSAEIFALLGEYHRLFTVYERYDGLNNLCTLNETKPPRAIPVDERIIDLLLFAKEMHRKTDGSINVAMGSVLSIWHEYREAGTDEPWAAVLSPQDQLREASAHTNIDDVVIDEANGTVMLADPDMRLDVGAIAKGYAVEMVARALEEKGISGYVINAGGNVRTVGPKAGGEKWKVGIENPADDPASPYVAYIRLSGESIVTSGSYQRYYVVDGKRYHHIIDPQTLSPSDRYLSLSVICKSSALGDALSTALFCMSHEDGKRLVESLDGVEAMWVFPDGDKRYSDGFSAYRD